MPASLDPQLALDERSINNPDLESALERRLRAKDDVSEARGVYKTHDKEVKAEIEKVGDFPPDSALRVGRFRITKRHVDAKHVEFDADARDQISIGLVDEDGRPARRGSRSKAAPSAVATSGDDIAGAGDDDADLRPTGEVNVDALRGEAERSIIKEPTPIRPGGRQASRNAHRLPTPPIQ